MPGNCDALNTVREELSRYWLKVLRRRGQKRRINWEHFAPITGLFHLKCKQAVCRFDRKFSLTSGPGLCYARGMTTLKYQNKSENLQKVTVRLLEDGEVERFNKIFMSIFIWQMRVMLVNLCPISLRLKAHGLSIFMLKCLTGNKRKVLGEVRGNTSEVE